MSGGRVVEYSSSLRSSEVFASVPASFLLFGVPLGNHLHRKTAAAILGHGQVGPADGVKIEAFIKLLKL